MTKKQNLLILSLLATIGVFIYLTVHHYAIKLGLSENSICSISQTFNCDAAALSSYSETLGIPVAVFGAVFNLIILCFVLGARLGWVDQSVYLKNSIRALLMTGAAVSVIMGLISLISVRVICPFCLASYVLSFINLALGWNLYAGQREHFEASQYVGPYKSHLIAMALIPLMAWVIAGMIQQNYGLDELKKIVPEKIAIWRSNPEKSIDYTNGISNHVTSEKAVVVEYADFKCPHCRDAAKAFSTFSKANPTVQMIFKAYPLDGICNANEKMPKGDGSRCVLAAYAICAEKIAQKGWEVQKWIFSRQDEFMRVTDFKPYLPDLQKEFGIDPATLLTCADAAETYAQIKQMSAEGEAAGVEGTPTVYLNRKKLPYGNILEILKTAVNEVK
ncbi:MAG: thioredoxin domain-containing protein [Bdellovibrionaceae bacterium]|nr:thioredoxin domain-containing protein [Bdellovibrio sp.]